MLFTEFCSVAVIGGTGALEKTQVLEMEHLHG
jgi:hypothetical protein